ncbi:MAG: hypothetical protein F4053_14310 [Proteobacteria bacterium]|nr:hypothetical protein [Pseudomonadota bacterium]MYJ96703.1 hypothetical protein [Pseudomonadota bacterium]
MKSAMTAVAAALIASVLTWLFTGQGQGTGSGEMEGLQSQISEIAAQITAGGGAAQLSIIEESEQDAWLRGANRDGSPRPGPADDQKPLADASNSLCFLTKVEIEGMDGPEDVATCSIQVDEFTNWWQVHATQGDGTDASVACNARCIVWE